MNALKLHTYLWFDGDVDKKKRPFRRAKASASDPFWYRYYSISEVCKNATHEAKPLFYGARLPDISRDNPKLFGNIIKHRPSTHTSLTDDSGVPVADDKRTAAFNYEFILIFTGGCLDSLSDISTLIYQPMDNLTSNLRGIEKL